MYNAQSTGDGVSLQNGTKQKELLSYDDFLERETTIARDSHVPQIVERCPTDPTTIKEREKI